jgi:hypothetical protein
MHRLRESLAQAQKAGAAVGHFNVADLVLLKAVFGGNRLCPVSRGVFARAPSTANWM